MKINWTVLTNTDKCLKMSKTKRSRFPSCMSNTNGILDEVSNFEQIGSIEGFDDGTCSLCKHMASIIRFQ